MPQIVFIYISEFMFPFIAMDAKVSWPFNVIQPRTSPRPLLVPCLNAYPYILPSNVHLFSSNVHRFSFLSWLTYICKNFRLVTENLYTLLILHQYNLKFNLSTTKNHATWADRLKFPIVIILGTTCRMCIYS